MDLLFTQLASDNFQRANENPLNPLAWSVPSASDGDENLTALQIVSDQCVPTVNYSVELYSAIDWPNDQYAQCVLESNGTASILLRSNVVSSTLECYNFAIFNVGEAGNGIIIANGAVVKAFTREVLFLSGLSLHEGDTILVAVVGLTLYAYQNGVLLGSATDAPFPQGYGYTSGTPGLFIPASSGGAATNFSGGSVAYGYQISGKAGIAGATVSYSGPVSGSVTADGSGNYSISSLPTGNYFITPSKSGYLFAPASQSVDLTTDTAGINFAGVVPDNAFGFSPNWLEGQQNAGLGIYISPGVINGTNYPGAKVFVAANATTYIWVTSTGTISFGSSLPNGVYPVASIVSGPLQTSGTPNTLPVNSIGVRSITDIRPQGQFSFS